MGIDKTEELRKLPAVDAILKEPAIALVIKRYGMSLVTHSVRQAVDNARSFVMNGKNAATPEKIATAAIEIIRRISEPSLKPVVNGTGIVLHTNLGRAPLGRAVLDELAPAVLGYSNLEFNLDKGDRGDRGTHCVELVTYLTGAEDALVVNNNAAAVILILSTFAKKKEVIVSRGELIEIGGAFRIPEIMAASGCKMVEVGTTNRTRLSDYENAVTEKTALLFKAHKSNYSMQGFVEEASVGELSGLAKKRSLKMVYDIGSGLLRKPAGLPLENEPDVVSSITAGADLVCFSCDKLLGGPQAGIIVGSSDVIKKLVKAPLMRALRPGKLTLAALSATLRSYITDKRLAADNPAYAMLSTTREALSLRAKRLSDLLGSSGIASTIIDSRAQCGGGTLPDLEIPSYAVMLTAPEQFKKNPDKFAEKVYKALMKIPKPVVGVLREGRLLFDVLTVFDEEIEHVAEAVSEIVGLLRSTSTT